MKISQIISHLDQTLHPEYQEDYDNSGFLVGDPEWETDGALLAVDLTPAVIDEALQHNLHLIVTHHPMIFSGIKRITSRNCTGQMLFRLIENHIAVYAAHTNLDNLKEGVNGILSQRLGLQQCSILKPITADLPDVGAGIYGTLETPMQTEQYLDFVKKQLRLPMLRCSNICKSQIHRVALCGGAGSFLIEEAVKKHCDILITADLKYHDFQRAEDRIILADAGHFETEQFAPEIIYSVISEKFSTFACRISTASHGYVCYI